MGPDEKTTELEIRPQTTARIVHVDFAKKRALTLGEGRFSSPFSMFTSSPSRSKLDPTASWVLRMIAIVAIAILSLLML